MGSSKYDALRQRKKRRAAEHEKAEQQAAAGAEGTAQAETEAPRRGRPPGKRSSGQHTQITAYIRKDVHRQVKIALLEDDDERDFSELVDELLASWVNDRTS